MTTEWFTANRDGLRQIHERLVERRGFGIIGGELYQNVMDTTATTCDFKIGKVEGRPVAWIEVTDDGEGFPDLTHAWTMFAPSLKKGDPAKAGRFNLGEKVVLSFAKEAAIETTTGMVVFDEAAGRKEYPRRKREKGTAFRALLACNQERYEQLLDYMHRIIVRDGLSLTVNGETIPQRTKIHQFETTLKTEIGDDLRPSMRNTVVEIYEPVGDEPAMLFELGIPVVETGDKWHVSVMQKVPLNVDRDNVTPAYLRSVRVAVLNEMHDKITSEDTTETWVNEATSDENCTPDAAEDFRKLKYGKNSVAMDPNNPEANAEAVAHGYIVIPSRGLSCGQRDNLKKAGTLQSSSQAFPTAGKGAYSDDPNAPPVDVIEEEDWSKGMTLIEEYTRELGWRLMSKCVNVRFVRCERGPCGTWAACYGRGCISTFDYNVLVLGRKWFDNGATPEVDKLIIHEFGHQFESNHLCEGYHEALCNLGAKLRKDVFNNREWYAKFTK